MKLKRVFRKEFFITLFFKQNKYHRFGVLLHTLALVYHTTKHKQYKMIPSAFLHDIGNLLLHFKMKKIKQLVNTLFIIMKNFHIKSSKIGKSQLIQKILLGIII